MRKMEYAMSWWNEEEEPGFGPDITHWSNVSGYMYKPTKKRKRVNKDEDQTCAKCAENDAEIPCSNGNNTVSGTSPVDPDQGATDILRVFRLPNNKPVKLKKHKMIAQAFNKRREIGQGRLSISFHSTHDDPLGMKFDLNSVSSMQMSSAWAAAIPRMVLRRGGMIHPTAGTLRRYSDSDVQSIKSFNRRMSQELESKICALNVPTEKSTKGTPGTNQPAMEGEPTKKRKRKKKKRGKNKVTPVTAFTAADGGAQAGGPRRPSAVSVDSNASAHSIHLSMERPGSTDTGSDRGVGPTGNPGQHPTELTTNLPPQFTAVNHMTSYSMFTASSFLPGMIELTDLDNPAPEMHQTPKTVPSSGNKSNSNHTYSNPIATDLTDEIVDVDEVIEIGDQSEYSVDSI